MLNSLLLLLSVLFKRRSIPFQADLLGERYEKYSHKAFKCGPFYRCQIIISFCTNELL